MRTIAGLCLVISIIPVLLSCSGGAGPDQSWPLFAVKAVGTDGRPIEGLRVGSINHSEYLERPSPPPMACPSTGISFHIPEASHVRLVIYNYYRETVKVLLDRYCEAGEYQVEWDGTDDDGDPLVSGFYYYHLTAGDFSDEKSMVLESAPDPQQTIIGATDEAGMFSSDDTLLFPCLLGDPPPITIVSETGEVLGVEADYYENSVTITLSDPAEPDKFMYFERPLRRTGNYFKLVWDPQLAR